MRFVQILSNLSRLKAHKVYLVILLVCIAVSRSATGRCSKQVFPVYISLYGSYPKVEFLNLFLVDAKLQSFQVEVGS